MNYQINISSFLQKYAIARDIFESGYATTKMNAPIEVQGCQRTHPAPGPFQIEICAERAGVVAAIDNFQLTRIARLAGAPMAEGAGLDILKKLGEPVAVGESLYRVHAEVRADFEFARNLSQRHCGYRIEDDYNAESPFAVEGKVKTFLNRQDAKSIKRNY